MKKSSVPYTLNVSNYTSLLRNKMRTVREKALQKKPNHPNRKGKKIEKYNNVLMHTRKETSEEVEWAVSALNIL